MKHHRFVYRKTFLQVTVELVGKNPVEWWFSGHLPNALKEQRNTIDELLGLLTRVVEDIKICVVYELCTHCKVKENME